MSQHKINFQKILNCTLQFLLAVLIFVYAFTILPLTILIFLPLKTCVFVLARIFRKDLVHFLSGQSSILAQENLQKPKLNICLYLVFEEHIDLEKLRLLFQERVIRKLGKNGRLMYPELQQYFTSFLNYTWWKKDEDFDLKNHVRLYDYIGVGGAKFKEGTSFLDENDLRKVIGPLLEKPWKVGRSPWELLIVPNFQLSKTPPNSKGKLGTVLIFRLHHALGDGYSILKLILRDFMETPPKIRINFPKVEGWKKIVFNFLLPFKFPWDMAGSIINSKDKNNCWHDSGKNNCNLTRKVWTSLSNPIDTKLIKEIKNRFGVGYNSVLCAVAASSCQRVMCDAGQMAPKEMTCMIPIPLPGHPDGLVNYATFHTFKWAMDKTLTREERLHLISKGMEPSKYYTAPLGFNLLAKVCLPFLPNSILKIARELPGFTVFATSLPGPEEAPTLEGFGIKSKLVDGFASFGPGEARVGTTLCLLSFNGKQRFVVNIDKALFPSEDIFQNIATYVEEELRALLEKKMSYKND